MWTGGRWNASVHSASATLCASPIATNTSSINPGDVLTLPVETGSVKVNTGDVEVAQEEGTTRTGTEVW